MSNNKVIYIGPSGGGRVPKNGASAKNYHLLKFLRSKSINYYLVDTEDWKKNPIVLFKLLVIVLFNADAKYILAANSESSYRLLQVISLLPRRRHVIYWVIGGSIADWIKDGKVKKRPYSIVDYFLVEGKKMQNTFAEIGFNNTIYVPNFKCIEYIPARAKRNDGIIRFVFLSRIIPEKGCEIIIDAARKLNKSFKADYIVDFYGPIDEDYDMEFKEKITDIPNVSYKGFIDLRIQKNYDLLAVYDAMLFPTYWHGEGFPGVIIDALISGIPVIASDWSLNADIIEDGTTGLLLKENSSEALANTMAELIKKPSVLLKMSEACQISAMNYDIKNVVSNDLLEKIGIC